MVSMFNISLNGQVGYARCIPELDESRIFDMEFNINTYEVLALSSPEERYYAGHAAAKLCSIYEDTGTLPETAESYWF